MHVVCARKGTGGASLDLAAGFVFLLTNLVNNFMTSFFEKIISTITAAVISVVASLGLISTPVQPQREVSVDQVPVIQAQSTTTENVSVNTDAEENKTSEKQQDKSISLIGSLKKQIEELTQKVSQPKKEEQPKTSIISLPSGAIVEMDSNGNMIRTIKEAPQSSSPVYVPVYISTPTQTQSSVSQSTTQTESALLTPVLQAKIDLGFSGNDSRPILATGWTAKNIYAQVYGDKGEKLSNVRINVTTPDESQNKALDYANMGTNNGIQGAFWFNYYPKFTGTHTITFSVPSYGLTKSISLEALTYTPLIPKIQLDPSSPTNVTMSSSGLDDKIITSLRVYPGDDEGEGFLILDNISYHLISDDFSAAAVEHDSTIPSGVEINICRGGSCLQSTSFSNGSWYVNHGGFSDLKITGGSPFSFRARVPNKEGKFKISIDSMEYIGERSGNSYIQQGLPFITPEVEVK